MKLVSATISDLPEIVKIYNETIASRQVTADLVEVTVESKRNWFHNHTKNRPLLVAKINEEICGWVSFTPFKERPAYDKTLELSIYISTNYRKKGIGTKIMAEVLSTAQKLQIETLIAVIFAHNLPSLALFNKFEFSCWGHLPEIADLDGTKCDVLILGKKLT